MKARGKSPSTGAIAAKVTKLIQLRVAVASGRAMAAVLLDKPEDQVTDAEALAAHTNHVKEGDEARQGRAIRAAWRATASALDDEGLLPGILGAHLTLALSDLDRGEVSGMAVPAPAPKRSSKAVARLQNARLLAFKVRYVMGRDNLSRENSLSSVTGTPKRDGKPYASAHGVEFKVPGVSSYSALQKLLAEGEKDLGKAKLDAVRAMGQAKSKA